MNAEEMTVPQLKAVLRERKKLSPNCKPYSKLRRAELINLVKGGASATDKLQQRLKKIEADFKRKSKLVLSEREKQNKAKVERRITRAKGLTPDKLTTAVVDRLEREVNSMLAV